MDNVRQQLWRIPDRFSPVLARWLIVLSLVIIGLAGMGLVLYDGWHRVAYFSAFLLIGGGNFAWALGSLLPDSRTAATLRGIVRLTTIPMFVALTIALGFQTGLWP
jgi:hypothetical protein